MNSRGDPFGPYRTRLLSMILEAGEDGISTQQLSEQLRRRYPEKQRGFIARNVATQLHTMRDIYIELLDGGKWRVNIVPPKTPPSTARRVKLSRFEQMFLERLICAKAVGVAYETLCSGLFSPAEVLTGIPSIAFARLIAQGSVLQHHDTRLFYYAFLGTARLSTPTVDVPRVPPPVPAWLRPKQPPLFGEDPTFTHLHLKRSQREMLEVVRLAGKDGITIQDIAHKLGKKTANGVTVTLGALANHGCVHQLDARTQHWYFGPDPRSGPT